MENQLLTCSGSEDQSCSSSILDTPKRTVKSDSESEIEDNINVTIRPTSVITNVPSEKEHNPTWRRNLTRSQRNKMRILLESGVSKEDARKKVFLEEVPSTPNAIKRTRESERGSSGEKSNAKRTRSHICPKQRIGLPCTNNQAAQMEVDQRGRVDKNTRGVEKRPKGSEIDSCSRGQTFKDVASQVNIGIVLKDFPNKQMSKANLDVLQEALLLKIEQQRNESVKPKITKCSYRTGYLVLTYRDKDTATG